jgi:hypothetical protein
VDIVDEATKLFSVKQLIHLRTGPWSPQVKNRTLICIACALFLTTAFSVCVYLLSLPSELCVVLKAEKIPVSVTRVLFE